MSKRRVLLVHSDRAISEFFRGKLIASGFQVDTAQESEGAVNAVKTLRPDVLATDLILGSPSAGVNFVKTAHGAAPKMPIITFPLALHPITADATRNGATRAMPSSGNPVGQLVTTIHQALGEAGAPTPSANAAIGAKELLTASSAIVNTIRNDLRVLSKQHSEEAQATLERLLEQAHWLTQRTAFAAAFAAHKLAGALELFLYELESAGAEVNESALRTLGQATDLLARLIEGREPESIRDPTGTRVFTLDDDPNVRKTIVAAMQIVELRATACGSAAEALSLLEQDDFELIFLDVGLPNSDGFEVCKKLRQIPKYKETPVVFLTGMSTFANRAKSTLSGANDFVGKPFHVGELGLKALLWIFKSQLDKS
jgi:DNA-binding response OmpR family regulator